jgi:hypothetical protein
MTTYIKNYFEDYLIEEDDPQREKERFKKFGFYLRKYLNHIKNLNVV